MGQFLQGCSIYIINKDTVADIAAALVTEDLMQYLLLCMPSLSLTSFIELSWSNSLWNM